MIANLNSDNVAWSERFQLARKQLRAVLDSGKGARNPAMPVENRWPIAILPQGLLPSCEERIVPRVHLRKRSIALRVCARF